MPSVTTWFVRSLLTRLRRGLTMAPGGVGRPRGQSLAEIALAMPLFLGLTLGTADGGRAIPWQTGDWAGLSSIATAAGLESSSTGTAGGSKISGATITVTWHCRNGLAIANAQNAGVTDPSLTGSDAIDVAVSYNLTLLTPLAGRLFGTGTPVIAADVRGRAEY